MNKDKAVEGLKQLQRAGEPGSILQEPEAHMKADEILCKLLMDLGYADVVIEWEEVPKWYE